MQGNSANDIATRLTKTGNSALSSLLAANQNIHNWVRQAMMLNLYCESLDDWHHVSAVLRIYVPIIVPRHKIYNLAINTKRGIV